VRQQQTQLAPFLLALLPFEVNHKKGVWMRSVSTSCLMLSPRSSPSSSSRAVQCMPAAVARRKYSCARALRWHGALHPTSERKHALLYALHASTAMARAQGGLFARFDQKERSMERRDKARDERTKEGLGSAATQKTSRRCWCTTHSQLASSNIQNGGFVWRKRG